jgi:hypothetical protein
LKHSDIAAWMCPIEILLESVIILLQSIVVRLKPNIFYVRSHVSIIRQNQCRFITTSE